MLQEPRLSSLIQSWREMQSSQRGNTGLRRPHYLNTYDVQQEPALNILEPEGCIKKKKILIDSIEVFFEHYAKIDDSMERISITKKFDELSYRASEYAIANRI